MHCIDNNPDKVKSNGRVTTAVYFPSRASHGQVVTFFAFAVRYLRKGFVFDTKWSIVLSTKMRPIQCGTFGVLRSASYRFVSEGLESHRLHYQKGHSANCHLCHLPSDEADQIATELVEIAK